MGYLKEKSSAMLYEQFGKLKYKYRNRELWCRGYYVDTAGKNASRIAEYIQNQLKEDEFGEQMMIPGFNPFTGYNANIHRLSRWMLLSNFHYGCHCAGVAAIMAMREKQIVMAICAVFGYGYVLGRDSLFLQLEQCDG